jgi:hypothetical protein
MKARRNLAIVWGREGIDHYIDLGFEFEFEKDLGCTESELWGSSPVEVKEATRSVQNASDLLRGAIAKHEHLSRAVSLSFERLEEYFLMNLTYEEGLGSLENVVGEYYDELRIRNVSFEVAEANLELCEQEYQQFLAENNADQLFILMLNSMAGLLAEPIKQ